MKLSISLPTHDVAVLDEYARAEGLQSRSAAVQHAVRLLRGRQLEQDYVEAWREWEDSGEQQLWDVVVGDGLPRAPG